MRGWEYIGQVTWIEWHEIAIDRDASIIEPGAIIAVSSPKDGELRWGTFQVETTGKDVIVARGHAGVQGNIPSIAERDHVYLARALGEHAFTRVS